jgi:hypothetical protein
MEDGPEAEEGLCLALDFEAYGLIKVLGLFSLAFFNVRDSIWYRVSF